MDECLVYVNKAEVKPGALLCFQAHSRRAHVSQISGEQTLDLTRG